MFNIDTFGFCHKIQPTNAIHAVACTIDISVSWNRGYGFRLNMYGPEIGHAGSRDCDIAENITI